MNFVGFSPIKDYLPKKQVMKLAELINMAVNG